MAYPEDIDTFREIENLPGLSYDPDDKKTLFMEDLQAVRDSIITIQQFIGTEENVQASPLWSLMQKTALLGLATRTSNATTTSSTRAVITGMEIDIVVPDLGRYVRFSFGSRYMLKSGSAGVGMFIDIYNETDAQIVAELAVTSPVSGYAVNPNFTSRPIFLDPGEYTFQARFSRDTDGTMQVQGAADWPMFLSAELV